MSNLSIRALFIGIGAIFALQLLLAYPTLLVLFRPGTSLHVAGTSTIEAWLHSSPSTLAFLAMVIIVESAVPAYIAAWVAGRAFVLNAFAPQLALLPFLAFEWRAIGSHPIFFAASLLLGVASTFAAAKLRAWQSTGVAR